jgi:hypothetical protein
MDMGGLGSGRWSRINAKASTDDYVQLDVSRWKRDGLLILGREFGGASAAGGIGPTLSAKVYLNHVVVTQEFVPALEGLRTTVIELERTNCQLGGARTWFRCPEKDCGRRVSKLYGADTILCRVCLNLTYPSQRLAGRDRALQICQNVRQQLGGSANLLEPFPPRPKNMRWSRYLKLWRRSREAEDRYWSVLSDFVEKLGRATMH